MPVETLFVVGAGLMGAGIAQVAAAAGYRVLLCDLSPEILERRLQLIARDLERRPPRDGTAPSVVLERIAPVTDLAQAAASQLAVEAVPEQMQLKKAVFTQLDRWLPPDAVLSTNTSSLSITELASVTGRPERVVGMHFFSPVPLNPLVELVRGTYTDATTMDRVQEVARRMERTVVLAQRDFPGFLLNRIWLPMINEAMFAVMEGIGTPEDIDRGFEVGYSHRVGPIRTADLAGLDVILAVLEALHAGLGDPKFRPCPLLRQMVRAGHLGKKSGQGFYAYGSRSGGQP